MASCSEISCNTGYLDLDQILLKLFAVDEDGCVGLKLSYRWGLDCEDLTTLAQCGMPLTVEQAIKKSIVDDGCGGWALNVFFTFPELELQ